MGEFGLASGETAGGGYGRVWYGEAVTVEEVAFEIGVFLLTKAKAEELLYAPAPVDPLTIDPPQPSPGRDDHGEPSPAGPEPEPRPYKPDLPQAGRKATLLLAGTVPRESWNRVGTRLLPKLQGSEDITVRVELSASVGAEQIQNLATELRQALEDLGLAWKVNVN